MIQPIRVRLPLVGFLLVVASWLISTPAVRGQQVEDRVVAMASWVAVDAPTGYETRGASALASALGGWSEDRWGNVVTTVGGGAPHHVIACALDRPTLVVTQITDDGYLRLHRIGRPSPHPLWDQQFTAQQVRVLTAAGPVIGDVLQASGMSSLRWLAPAARQPGSHLEVVTEAEADWLLGAAAREIRMSGAPTTWVAAPAPAPLRAPSADPAYDGLATQLTDLVERPAVAGHEWSVRRAVLESLPAWARDRAVVDDIGNVTVSAGPERGDATVFIAHMDEVGYVVDTIADDGTVTLASRGGVTPPAWEGQTALLHFDPPGAPSMATGKGVDTDARWKAQSLTAAAPPPLRGVFSIRDAATTRQPDAMQAWFGLDGAALEARGVRAGLQVASHKAGLRMGITRVQDIVGRAGLPLQIGLTQGGTDGTTFTFWGASNQGLSWPGRYSHSPAEVLDLRDLEALGRVIAAVAAAP